jgi:hypothetical protein
MRWPYRLARVLIPLVILSTLLALFTPCLSIPLDVYNSAKERDRLLHKTDHQELLRVCRDFMERYPGAYIISPDDRLPELFRDLGVNAVLVEKEFVHVELHGGFDHYGVIAYAEDVPAERQNGDQKLIEGLWYFTDSE